MSFEGNTSRERENTNKPALVAIAYFLLAGSLFGNIVLVYQAWSSGRKPMSFDRHLVGTWTSKNPNGVRLILLQSGEFALTNYGTPYGPIGFWRAHNGFLEMRWANDEEGGLFEVNSPFKLTNNGQNLEIANDSLTSGAKAFVKAQSDP